MPRGLVRRLKRWHYPRLLRGYGMERWPESAIVTRLVQPGDHVIDAGANIGYISLLLSRMVGPLGVVHSFEPVPTTHEFLAHNVAALALHNIRVRRVAVSDTPGVARMATPDYVGGGENLYESHLVTDGSAETGTFEVEVARLDDQLGADADRVTFIKIDVEGHELAALRGANRILAARPALLIEVAGDPDAAGSQASELFAMLFRLGYSPWRLADGQLVRRVAGDRSVDYFFLTEAHFGHRLAGNGPA